ncbi:DUF5615 family PIN-like protein [Candidatus Nitrospira neomarina]|uniref:DUF5615 family PIN-like protein n=1 Tax=Candidatus Nitrospira neomarina TaxID=3020899 RepID=A0AA96GK24_9BACT|nr:DUF5615 family PIN-like protein [Candidatus Nitrospira neomarina]WNM63381.1 DUF5615 family PIN-like protein [Candidatus Nitrospira neomarina]
MSERYLADENFPASIVKLLRTHGHDVLYAAESLIAASDEEVLREAVTQSRVLLTFDRDFGELVLSATACSRHSLVSSGRTIPSRADLVLIRHPTSASWPNGGTLFASGGPCLSPASWAAL